MLAVEYLYEYIDDLLRLQSRAVEKYNHKGVLGDAREEFIHSEIRSRIDNLANRLHKGEVYFKDQEFGQHDIILRKRGTLNSSLGRQIRISSEECAAIIEVKTNAKLTEISDFEEKSKKLKQRMPNLVCGMFCYKISGKTSTVLERSGLKFDREYQIFEQDSSKKIYDYIDFILCLDDNVEVNGIDRHKADITYSKGFFLKKENNKYQLFHSAPFSKMFFQELKRADELN
ncbi:DUF6602 domain-containing protein [Shewanella xiamenensis]|uniref:DUF6602 domain-containing protein n=1 Tax=Shewanella xiamenensis TaxID=332186 RepID=A0AAW6QZX3_9GAMM|nr:DUF6602 domain-containing protein [Shewanella xiamenensis]MDG5901005.1 hypothetical protein [Shewanella xiamenensis]BDA62766.1 hypothetical protein NUITMVS1_42290 [Shewanella xiamenensis]BDQ68292.1 hypothetical protein NUITMVS2_41050 [Shewanella xiamenensis]GLD79218.1 hypothetical protein NUITMVS3_36520 [Shewanella xiamenensis]